MEFIKEVCLVGILVPIGAGLLIKGLQMIESFIFSHLDKGP